jgi:hypothetical protein
VPLDSFMANQPNILIVEDAKPCDLGEIHTRIQAVLARVEAAWRIPLSSVEMSGELRESDFNGSYSVP